MANKKVLKKKEAVKSASSFFFDIRIDVLLLSKRQKEVNLKVRETHRRVLSFLLAFLLMFSSIHSVFAYNSNQSEKETETSNELVELDEMSLKDFNESPSAKDILPSDADGTTIETICFR